MGKINYKSIYEKNRTGWREMTDNPGKYEALLSGHYSDSNHFVYELLQNAEDTKATSVVFEYNNDNIAFYHDGKPFDEADVIGVSSMLETTKADDAQTIGKFGMGFKSVFKYTCEPVIHSDSEAFKIVNYLLPVEIESEWDYKHQMKEGMTYYLDSEAFIPFVNSNHLTKVILPFQKRSKTGELIITNGNDIVTKLKELEPEILLFLSNIKTLFWIDKTNNKYELFRIIESEDDNLVICKLKGNVATKNTRRYEDLYFYKYNKYVHHNKMQNAQVSLAFQTNSLQKSITRIDNPNIWVYFPTKDRTSLPCLLHGSFETAVSREKLMRPSDYNNTLFKAAVELFSEAVVDFKKKGLITQAFIRQILITAFSENLLSGLKQSVTELFKNDSLIPAKDGGYISTKEALVTVPFDLIDLYQNDLVKKTFPEIKSFVTLNDERAAGFTEYYSWLKNDLNVEIYSIDKWAKNLGELFENQEGKADYDSIVDLYEFLNSYKQSDYNTERKVNRKKSEYEEDLQKGVESAWPVLRNARILINAEYDYISAYSADDEPNVYLSSTSEYHKITKSAIVLSFITSNYKTLLTDSFLINEFDNYEYVRTKVCSKYPDLPQEIELTTDFIREYADDILQICRLVINSSYMKEMKELIRNKCIVLAYIDGTLHLMKPEDVYKSTSIEGADMVAYYSGLGRSVAFLHDEFYKEKGISIENIIKLGVNISPVCDGPIGRNDLRAVGEFRPYLDFKHLSQNINYIQSKPKDELSKKKSAAILKIALENVHKLSGKITVGTDDSYKVINQINRVLENLRQENWLYSNGKLSYLEDITRSQLDRDVYKEIGIEKYNEQFRILGFDVDEIEQTFDDVSSMDNDTKQRLLKKLAKELGVGLSIAIEEDIDSVFNPDDFDMSEFPIRYIKNQDRLNRYVENQFYAADHVRYKEVIVRQRTSGNKKVNQSYVREMYTNQYGKLICQGCRRIMGNDELFTVEIANFGLEMEQLHMCMCPNCYQKYESIKMTRADEYKDSIKRAIINMTIGYKMPYYEVVASNMPLYFTQTHLAEIQEILKLIDDYGLPSKELEQIINTEKGITGGKLDEIVVHDGEYIEYQTMSDLKTHKVTLDIDKYSLHKEMDGRPIGVVFEYKGQKYRITQKL